MTPVGASQREISSSRTRESKGVCARQPHPVQLHLACPQFSPHTPLPSPLCPSCPFINPNICFHSDVAFGNKVRDPCGICGGSNKLASCLGCDGVIYPPGAARAFDSCKVCGGNGNHRSVCLLARACAQIHAAGHVCARLGVLSNKDATCLCVSLSLRTCTPTTTTTTNTNTNTDTNTNITQLLLLRLFDKQRLRWPVQQRVLILILILILVLILILILISFMIVFELIFILHDRMFNFFFMLKYFLFFMFNYFLFS